MIRSRSGQGSAETRRDGLSAYPRLRTAAKYRERQSLSAGDPQERGHRSGRRGRRGNRRSSGARPMATKEGAVAVSEPVEFGHVRGSGEIAQAGRRASRRRRISVTRPAARRSQARESDGATPRKSSTGPAGPLSAAEARVDAPGRMRGRRRWCRRRSLRPFSAGGAVLTRIGAPPGRGGQKPRRARP